MLSVFLIALNGTHDPDHEHGVDRELEKLTLAITRHGE